MEVLRKEYRMKEVFEKISSYQIFNYLLPGLVYVVILREFTKFNIYQEDLFPGVFLYYFTGLVISRFGSLVIEPVLVKLKFIKFDSYKNFVLAADNDKKMELFVEVSNMYRTLLAMLTLLMFAKLYDFITTYLKTSETWKLGILLMLLLILLLFSYRKQTNFINQRVEIRNSNS